MPEIQLLRLKTQRSSVRPQNSQLPQPAEIKNEYVILDTRKRFFYAYKKVKVLLSIEKIFLSHHNVCPNR